MKMNLKYNKNAFKKYKMSAMQFFIIKSHNFRFPFTAKSSRHKKKDVLAIYTNQ